jgi:hypothetical protein
VPGGLGQLLLLCTGRQHCCWLQCHACMLCAAEITANSVSEHLEVFNLYCLNLIHDDFSLQSCSARPVPPRALLQLKETSLQETRLKEQDQQLLSGCDHSVHGANLFTHHTSRTIFC